LTTADQTAGLGIFFSTIGLPDHEKDLTANNISDLPDYYAGAAPSVASSDDLATCAETPGSCAFCSRNATYDHWITPLYAGRYQRRYFW
jgi:hypothetical protein